MKTWERASPSQIKTYLDCNTKWYDNKIIGLEMPGSKSTDLGGIIHKYIEDYLQGKLPEAGIADAIVEPAMPYLHYVKQFNPIIELEFTTTTTEMPVNGRIDMFWIDGRVGNVVDHKSSGNFKWCLKEAEVKVDAQAILYSYYVFENYDVDSVNFALHYLLTVEPYETKLVTVTYTREEIGQYVAQLNKTMLAMKGDSITADRDRVLKNKKACYKYGGCPFRDRCLPSSDFTQTLLNAIAPKRDAIDLSFLDPTG